MSITVNKTRLPVTLWQTESGSVVSVNNARRRDAKSAIVTLEPIQDLHGYSNPWVGGAGKNKYPIAIGNESFVNNGSATHSNSNGSLVIVTNASSSASGVYLKSGSRMREVLDSYDVPLTVSMDIVASASGNVRIVFCGTQQLFSIGTTAQRISVTATSNTTKNFNIYGVNNGATLTISNLQVESGSTPSPYEPYENLCPISGHSAVTLNHAGTSQSDNPTSITVQLGQTIYGGTVDLVSGVGTLTMANIASYNGETIGEPWLSSMDKYVAGATPTTGAQVVYTLATPITFQLTPTQIAMLERNNTIWADEGDIEVRYARIRQ